MPRTRRRATSLAALLAAAALAAGAAAPGGALAAAAGGAATTAAATTPAAASPSSTTSAAPGTAPAPRATLYEIEDQVMCVVCRTPLAVAGGPQADAQRELIRALIADGLTTEQIKTALVAEYGERVLALPEDDGFTLAVYLVPVLAVASALVLAAVFLPRWRRRAATAAGDDADAGPELSPEDAQRLADDLRRYDA